MSSFHARRFAQNGADAPSLRLDADISHVLGALAQLGGKPVETCRPIEARAQPGLDQALQKIGGRNDDPGVEVETGHIPGPAGELGCRIYRPRVREAGQRAPMIIYLPGGGFVLGDIGRNQAVPRFLARKTGAVVIALHVRQAPEFKFPAAYDDAHFGYGQLIAQAEEFGANAANAAIVGEEAGASLALHIGLEAANHGGVLPTHLGLITPLVDPWLDQTMALEIEQLPFNTARLRWALRHALREEVKTDRRLNPIERGDLDGLPPVTLIMAEMDPLREQGLALAAALRRQGVWVDATLYDGVCQGFFGLGAVVNKAMFAQSQLAANLNAAFAPLRAG